jgi:hypothetical protein|tara:strand:- start:90 stop:431 length:342 start_codon:yes stop_codon:yes gene_type:complete
MNEITDAINQYGVPTVTAVGMAYFIYYIWKFVTKNILPALGQASGTLIHLIDRVRMLDNDMIRLDQKINTIIEIQDQQNDPFEKAQKIRDQRQDNKIDTNSAKIEKLKEGKKK